MQKGSLSFQEECFWKSRGEKLQLSKTFVQDAKKREGLHTYKVQKAPNRNKRQNMVGKSRARKLYIQMLTKPHYLIMDDETYVKADFRQLPGLLFFTVPESGALHL